MPLLNNKQPNYSDETKSLADSLSSKKQGELLDSMQALTEDPKYSATVPNETRDSLKQAINDAKDLYGQQTTRNDWLEVAQTLAQAVAQFGAAQRGMQTGYNMAGAGVVPKIDYGARSDRSFREYQQSIRNAQDLAGAEEAARKEQEAQNRQDYGRRYDTLQEALKQKEAEANRKLQEERFRNELGREASREKKADERLDRSEQAARVRENRLEMNSLTDQAKSLQGAINSAMQLQDASGKEADRLEKDLASQAAKAGKTPEEVIAAVEKNKQEKPGVWSAIKGFVSGEKAKSPEELDAAKKQALNNLYEQLGLTATTKKIEELKRQNDELIGKYSQSSRSVSSPSAPPTPPSEEKSFDAKQLAAYAAQYKLSEDAARKYLESQGYKFK